jgi:RNA polymerase sigma-70 factor (ECF subfamily)
MHAAVSHLPAQQKEVYRLIKQQGLKRSEAARQLGIKPNTVKAHLSSAIRSIREFCTSHLDYHTIIILSVSGYYLPL